MTKTVVWVLGGGTVEHVRPHLALSAPAYGSTARQIAAILQEKAKTEPEKYGDLDVRLCLTRMADPTGKDSWVSLGETNTHIRTFFEAYIDDAPPSIIFLNVAFCDFRGSVFDKKTGKLTNSGKNEERLKTSEGVQTMSIGPTQKLISRIRKDRKDIFLVGFKTTASQSTYDLVIDDEMETAGFNLLKQNSCNLVLANDIKARRNVILTPELAKYRAQETEEGDRTNILKLLVNMTLARASNRFSRTKLNQKSIYGLKQMSVLHVGSLAPVVQHCVRAGAYRPFNNVTVGHFGIKDPTDKTVLWSSRRKKNYNNLPDLDLVRVEFETTLNAQVADGEKPSAGVRSQYEVLKKFDDLDCIIHFHCPLKRGYDPRIGVAEQRDFECGSHECGKNTSDGMNRITLSDDFGNKTEIAAVFLTKHGPNICFSSKADPVLVIKFIEENFDLSSRAE